MKQSELDFVAANLRDVANEIESGKWGSVHVERQNDHTEKPRMSWMPLQGWELQGYTVTIRVALPRKPRSTSDPTPPAGKVET